MKVAIMQPYFFPYIGYFQLINAVDKFVIYDNIEFTKKGWINRNRILANGNAEYFTLPLKKDSDFLNVNQRFLADSYSQDKVKILGKISQRYQKSPEYHNIFPIVKSVFNQEQTNLFEFILNALRAITEYLGIDTKIIVSSEIPIDHALKSADKVIAICKNLNATQYYNPIGGIELYSKAMFQNQGLELNFVKPNTIEYKQFDREFVPSLSIIDMLFFNSKVQVQQYLNEYAII